MPFAFFGSTHARGVFLRAISIVAAIILSLPVLGGLVVNENSTWPQNAAVATFVRNAVNVEQERDIRTNRNLGQTFQLSAPIKLDKIYIDYEEGVPGKEITIRLYSVTNVNNATLIEPGTAAFTGTLFFSLKYTNSDAITSFDGGNDPLAVMEFDLTGADEVTLPASTGTAGYAFQILRTGEGSDSDNTIDRAFKWHWNDGENLYAGGRSYAINFGGVDASDDFLLAIEAVDTIAPTIADVRGNAALDRLTVVFSEGMEAASMTNVANYSVPTLTLSNAELLSQNMVRFTTTPQTAGAQYVLTVNGVKDDASAGNTITNNSTFTFKALAQGTGFLTAEFFNNILPRDVTVPGLTLWPAFMNNAPDEVRHLPNFSTPSGYGEDYGVRVSGVLIPKESGDYHFFIRSDDNSSLYINPAGAAIPDPNVVSPIASEVDTAGPFQEPDLGDPTTSAPITLTANQRYGVLFLLKEGAGNDFGQVAWRKVGDTTPAASLAPISGEFFETFVDATGATVSITNHPTSQTVVEGRLVTFTAGISTTVPAGEVGYQWLRNGTNIPGATGASYSITNAPASDNNATFAVRVRVPGTAVTSNPATLTVSQDATAPTVVGARSALDRVTVTVSFSEAIDAASIADVGNFSLNPAVTISDPRVVAGTNLVFTVSELLAGTNYTVTISGVKDLAGNTMAANGQATFRAIGPLIQGENGYVVWEAEDYYRLVGTRWRKDTTSGQPSGTGSMESPDGAGTSEFGDHLEYDIEFTKTGTNYIWVRAGASLADPGGADSVWLHVYPVGTPPSRPTGAIDRTLDTYAGLTGFSGGSPAAAFVWARNANTGPSPMTFDIPTPGVYTIGIGIREDGAFVDKFVVTTNPGFTPTGAGPNVTPKIGEPLGTPSTITISGQPTNQTVFENLSAAFTVTATSPDPLIAYQWQRKNGAVFEDIPGATGPTLSINPALFELNGSVYRARIFVTGNSTNSGEATLTVVRDLTAPTAVVSRARSDTTTLMVVFSEAMRPELATDLANYSAGTLGLFGVEMVGDRVVRFSTANMTVGTEYTLTINNLRDLAGNLIAPNTQTKFFGVGMLVQRDDGFVVWEAEDYDRKLGRWTENSSSGIPSGGLSMNAPDGAGTSEFGDHLEYDVVFTRTGTHAIYLRGRANDGNADSAWFHVYPQGTAATRPSGAINRTASTDASMQGYNVGAAADFVWRSDAQTGADPMTFDIPTPGVYTIGLGNREDGFYADKFVIRLQPSTFVPVGLGPNPTPREGAPAIPADIVFTLQPTNRTVIENRMTRFSVGATSTDPAFSLQWQVNAGSGFQDIAGETQTNLVVDPVRASAVYRVRAVVPGRTNFSSEATLTMIPDNAPPVAQAAGAFAGGTVVGIAFDEAINPAALGNYTVSGVNVSAAAVVLKRYVRLNVSGPVAPGFTVTVSGAQDLKGNPMAGQAVLNGLISDLSAQDIGTAGDPAVVGETFTWGSGYYVAGGGSDIFGTADHGYFVYKQFTGAFDMRARVDDLVGGDEFAKAMLMVRESLDAGSRNAGVLITKNGPFIAPSSGGVDVYNFQWRDTTNGASASTPAAIRISPTIFPSWLRLVRATATTNKFDAYMSVDGTNWTVIDTHTIPAPNLPATVYLGMAATAHDNAVGFPRAEMAFESFSISALGGSGFDPGLSIAKNVSGVYEIRWNSGTLLSSGTVAGTFAPVNGATSPYPVPQSQTNQFYIVRQ